MVNNAFAQRWTVKCADRLTGGGWKLVKTVTAFTLSHSITLILATLGYVHIPQRPVEGGIALSIVFVVFEFINAQAGRPGITKRALC